MKKIVSLFMRDYTGNRQVFNQIVEGAEWVVEGEGKPTLKIDGTSVLIQDGNMFKRYDAKHGKTPPPGWIKLQDEPDPNSGHWPGWLPVSETDPADKWHMEGLMNTIAANNGLPLEEGTYELVGPKVGNKGGGNPYGLTEQILRKHGEASAEIESDPPPRDFDGLKAWFEKHVVEGIVWHHPDGRMVKIKRRDFGLDWPAKKVGE